MLTSHELNQNNKPKAKGCNWSIVLDYEMKFKHDIEVSMCLGTWCSLCSSHPACEVIHPSVSTKNYLFSFTSANPTLDPLHLIIVCTLFYMYWLEKRGHYMWWYFTCIHVSKFENPLYYVYIFLQDLFSMNILDHVFLSHVVSTIFVSDLPMYQPHILYIWSIFWWGHQICSEMDTKTYPLSIKETSFVILSYWISCARYPNFHHWVTDTRH